jgi:hypothetical protein
MSSALVFGEPAAHLRQDRAPVAELTGVPRLACGGARLGDAAAELAANLIHVGLVLVRPGLGLVLQSREKIVLLHASRRLL